MHFFTRFAFLTAACIIIFTFGEAVGPVVSAIVVLQNVREVAILIARLESLRLGRLGRLGRLREGVGLADVDCDCSNDDEGDEEKLHLFLWAVGSLVL